MHGRLAKQKTNTMKKTFFGLAILAAISLTSCKNKSDEAQLTKNVETAGAEVQQFQHELDSVQTVFDGVSSATYASKEAKDEAIEEAQETLDGVKSKLENAQQKLSAAMQNFKDATGKV